MNKYHKIVASKALVVGILCLSFLFIHQNTQAQTSIPAPVTVIIHTDYRHVAQMGGTDAFSTRWWKSRMIQVALIILFQQLLQLLLLVIIGVLQLLVLEVFRQVLPLALLLNLIKQVLQQ